MNLLKLTKNRISREWKETFNNNVDYLLGLENDLKNSESQTNSRIDNLVLNSGGTSPNEVVDSRVNNKGTTFDTLQSRLTDFENKTDEEIAVINKAREDLKDQVNQLNDSVEYVLGGSADWLNLYVSKERGSDQNGDGSEEKPFATIQMAVNQIPLICIPGVTIRVDDGVYLEDVIIRNVNFTTFYIEPMSSIATLDVGTMDCPVKVRSLAFYQCKGYFKVTGFQFVDVANTPLTSGIKYSLQVEQGGYMAVDRCKFYEDARNLTQCAVYVGGLSASNIYGTNGFSKQNICVYAILMSQALVNKATRGGSNTTGTRCSDAIIRGRFRDGFSDIQETVSGFGLIIAKGTVLA